MLEKIVIDDKTMNTLAVICATCAVITFIALGFAAFNLFLKLPWYATIIILCVMIAGVQVSIWTEKSRREFRRNYKKK